MLLYGAARIAKDIGCEAINEVMDARQRFSPWEINERWLQIVISQELHREARKPGSPAWRIHDEYPENKIKNVSSEDGHPIDIVVLHPLSVGEDPWADCSALGAIEIKKSWGNWIDDARRLARLARLSPAVLKWVMLVAFINGPTNEAVLMNDQRINHDVGQFGLRSVLPCEPKVASPRSEINPVGDTWFDMVCYGIDV